MSFLHNLFPLHLKYRNLTHSSYVIRVAMSNKYMQMSTALLPPYPTPGEHKVLTKIYPHIQYTTI